MGEERSRGDSRMSFEREIGVGPAMGTNQDHGSRATLSGVASSRIKRRAVLHAGWAVPVVLAVTAAPALALSQPIYHRHVQRARASYPGNSCNPGQEFGYHMVVVFHSELRGHRAHRQPSASSENADHRHHAEHLPPRRRQHHRRRSTCSRATPPQRSAVITYTFTAERAGHSQHLLGQRSPSELQPLQEASCNPPQSSAADPARSAALRARTRRARTVGGVAD